MNPPNPYRETSAGQLAPIDEGSIPDCSCPRASMVREKIEEVGAFETVAWLMVILTSFIFVGALFGAFAGRESVLAVTLIAIIVRDFVFLGVFLRQRLRRLWESNRELLRRHDPDLAQRESGLRTAVARWNVAAAFLNRLPDRSPELSQVMENARMSLVRDIAALKARADMNP